MSKGLGPAHSKQWRVDHPKEVEAYRRSAAGKFAQMKRQAKRKNHILELTVEDLEELISGNTCHYCRGPLSTYGYSVDRVDHRKGYLKDNVVACCGIRDGRKYTSCNFRKGRIEAAGFVFPRTVELLLELLESEKHE